MIRLVVAGAAGRMGKAILSLALQDPGLQITGGLERSDSPALNQDVGELLAQKKIECAYSFGTANPPQKSGCLDRFYPSVRYEGSS